MGQMINQYLMLNMYHALLVHAVIIMTNSRGIPSCFYVCNSFLSMSFLRRGGSEASPISFRSFSFTCTLVKMNPKCSDLIGKLLITALSAISESHYSIQLTVRKRLGSLLFFMNAITIIWRNLYTLEYAFIHLFVFQGRSLELVV